MQRAPALFSVFVFVFFLLHGSKTISLDTDAQAGITYLFLPFYALVPAIAVWGLSKSLMIGWKYRTGKLALVISGTVSIAITTSLFWMYNFATGARAELVAFQQESTKERELLRTDVRANRKQLRQLQSDNPGQESAVLEEQFTAATSTAMRLAIAQNEFAQPELLDLLARTGEIVVINNVLRHKATSPSTLVWIFREYVAHDQDGYGKFLEANLSKHPNAPSSLLRDIYVSGQFYSPKNLLENPNLPHDIKKKLQDSDNSSR